MLLPVEDAAARVESAMGTLAGGEVLASPALVMNEVDLEDVQRELLDEARAAATLRAKLEAAGGDTVGEIVSVEPIQALIAQGRRGARPPRRSS